MTVAAEKVVSIDYTLRGDDGQTIDSSEGRAPLDYLHGAQNIVPGLERELEGKAEGDQILVSVAPTEGYGDYDPKNVFEVPRSQFAESQAIEPGMRFQAQTPEGVTSFLVKEVGEDSVKLDGNHPLAGATLHFDVTVRAIRDASPEEVEHGHVHQSGGCCGGNGGGSCGCH
ncbi:MAG: peptidylprolyl isomerase [Puniceicoccaceae bacterium]